MDKKNAKRHVISIAVTFVSAFAVVFCATIQEQNFVFSQASLVSLGAAAVIAGVRAVAKIIVELALGYTK